MNRLGAFLAACVVTLASSVALADERAEKLAREADALMYTEPPRLDEAIEKFRQAIVLSPEGKYYLRLCVAYAATGELGLALQSCDAVKVAGGDAKTMSDANKVIAHLEGKIRENGGDPEALRKSSTGTGTGDGGGDTGTGDTGTGDTGTGTGDTGTGDTGTGTGDTGGGGGTGTGGSGAVGLPTGEGQFKAAPLNLYQAKPATHDYTWSLGGELYGFSATVGQEGAYAGGGAGFRLHADYIVMPQYRVGIQGYVGGNSIGEESAGQTLSIVDLGAAAFMHVTCSGRLCITPLAGVQLTGFQPADTGSEVSFASLGLRLEGAASLALGTRYEHVLSAQLGATFYTPPVGDYNGMSPNDFQLDRAGQIVYFGVGYTHRFDTPFGQAPFITLE